MTQVQQIAALVQRAEFGELSDSAKHHLKMHILDALGCALRCWARVRSRRCGRRWMNSGATAPAR